MNSPSFLDSAFSAPLFLVDVLFELLLPELTFREAVPRDFLDEEGATDDDFACFSSLESMIAFEGEPGESEVLVLFVSFSL